MRRARACIAVLALALLALPASSAATPEVRFKALPLPIPGYPETGYMYGAGAALEVEYRISGREYEGSPPPLSGINIYFPKGTTLHTGGFPTCAEALLEPSGPGPKACPKASHAGPPGEALGFVTLGGERVREQTTIESFYAPGGGVEFFTSGHSPVSLEILSTGRPVHLGGSGAFGPEFESQIPLVESLPGAPYASVERIRLQAGSAYGPTSPRKATYYGRIPRRGQCPSRGFVLRTEVIFAEVAALPRQVVTKEYRAPCPRRSVR